MPLHSYGSAQNRNYQPILSVNADPSPSSCDETTWLLGAQTADDPDITGSHVQILPDTDKNVEIENRVEEKSRSHHSIITIFSMWNTMMGTSLLSIPWAVEQAGFINGIVLLVIMAGLMAYASYRVLAAYKSMSGQAGFIEFSDVVRIQLGRVAEVLALVFSLLTLVGGTIVFWILMSNFLYHIGMFIYSHTTVSSYNISLSHIHINVTTSDNINSSIHSSLSTWSDVMCSNETEIFTNESSTFEKAWSETHTLPFYLIPLMLPLMCLKSATFFTKFNSLGTLSIIYLLVFVAVKASQWGINLDLLHTDSIFYGPAFKWSFPALTGIAALAYFLQNCLITIVRHQKNPENDARDLIIAYGLVCLTYTYMGAMFYATFPLSKFCIEDNLLNNIPSADIMAFVARIGLFFQLMTVLPMLTFVIRSQLMHFLFKSVWPSFLHVLVLNVVVVALCVVFAVFLPTIGHIISFIGAFCGYSYGIAIPCVVYLVMCYRDDSLTVIKLILHGLLLAAGLAKFIAQFVIVGDTT